MKRQCYFVFFTVLIFPFDLFTQTNNTGKLFLDGSLGLEISGSKAEFDQLNFKFFASPGVGYYLSERNAFGAGIGHEFIRNRENDHIQNIFLIELFYKRYFFLDDNSNLFGEIRASFGPGFSSEYGGSDYYELQSFQAQIARISLGYTYLNSPNFGIHFSIGFLEYNGEISSVKHVSIMNSGRIGFQYIFK